MTDNAKRLKIIEKIANLRARAEDAGSSESEMTAAIMHAEKLMQAYQIEEAELALAETEGKIVIDIVTKTMRGMYKNESANYKPHRHKFILTFRGIEMFTDTKCVMHNSGQIAWTGHRPDVEMAEYLAMVIRHAMDAEWPIYARTNPQRGRGAKASFETAMALRISNRLQQMASERNKQQREEAKQIENSKTASSTALVIVEAREEKIRQRDEVFRQKYPRLGSARGFAAANNGSAFSAGQKAGDRVNLGRAIGGGAPVARIG